MHTISNDFENYDNILHYLDMLIELADVEKEIGDYEAMEKVCYDIVLFMQKYIPFKEWNFSIFRKLEDLMNSEEISDQKG